MSMLPELRRHAMPATLYFHTGHPGDGSPVVHLLASYTCMLSGGAASDTDLVRAQDQTCAQDEREMAYEAYCERHGIEPADYAGSRNFAYMTDEELRELFRSGIDVQLHTHTHTLVDFSPDTVKTEIERNTEELSNRLGVSPTHFRHFCYPSGLYAAAAVEELRRLGIASATTCATGLAGPDTDVLELPRIMDGDHLADIEFEAELSGFSELLRRCRRALLSPGCYSRRRSDPADAC